MPRAYWRGHLRLSLVTCPIELFPAVTQSHKTHFHQINTRTGNRLRQKMVDEETGREVDKEHKGRGYELTKGKYVPIEPEELEAVEIESNKAIEIDKFVPRTEIDKRYLDRPYYITPSGDVGAEAFAVIRNAMKDEKRVAIARIVIAEREHVIALEPLGKGLLGTTLRFEDEVRSEKTYFKDIKSARVSSDMVSLARHILKTKEGRFDPSKFKDRYDAALKKLVRRKAKGHKIEARAEEEKPEGNVVNLMELLRQSAKGKRKAPPKRRRSHKRKAA